MGLSFTEDNIKAIILDLKRMTRRLTKDNELFIPNYKGNGDAVVTCYADDAKGDIKYRLKYQVGRKYKIVAGQTLPQVYYRFNDANEIELAHVDHYMGVEAFAYGYVRDRDSTWLYYAKNQTKIYGHGTWQSRLIRHNFQPLSYRITSLRNEPLQDITWDGAWAEGVNPVSSRPPILNFIDIWDSLHAKKGHGWLTNPIVRVIEFEVVVDILIL